MSVLNQPGNNAYLVAFGTSDGTGTFLVYFNAAPGTNTIQGPHGVFPVGTVGVWPNNAIYQLIGYTSIGGPLQANWIQLASSSGAIVAVVGTTNQITVTTTAGTSTISLPTTLVAPGSIASTTTLTGGTGITATTGNITATAGNFVSSAAGNGIVLNSGTASGTTAATLNGRSGQITITTPSIAAGAQFTFTITNSAVTASTTQILYGLTGGTNGAAVTIQSVTNSAGQSVVVLNNASAVTNNTGSLVLTFLVLN
jgi:hypothetical protein